MSINIIAAECLFPSGPTLELADIAIKTQFALIKKHPFFVDQCGDRIKVSYFPALKAMDKTRFLIIAKEILTNLKEKLIHLSVPHGYRLWLVLPEREGGVDDIEDDIISEASVISHRWKEITVLKGTHAKVSIALQKIMQYQQTQKEEKIFDVILAIDSYMITETLMYLDANRRIHNSYYFDSNMAVQNPYGFIPSEGAAAIVMSSEVKGIGCLESVEIDFENNLRDSNMPCVGSTLTQVAKHAMTKAESKQVSYIVSDFNGEVYRADEYGFTLARLNTILHDKYLTVLPTLATGDLGCASLLVHIAVMVYQYSIDVEKNKDKHILILSSSEDSLRSAIVLSE